jgi:hypothetical protein
MKSNIARGQMFLHYNPTYMNAPKVWVKVDDTGEEPSVFVDNYALVKASVNPDYKIGIREKWLITDRYYGEMVRKGEFVPFDDLREVDGICTELGVSVPEYEFDI